MAKRQNKSVNSIIRYYNSRNGLEGLPGTEGRNQKVGRIRDKHYKAYWRQARAADMLVGMMERAVYFQ